MVIKPRVIAQDKYYQISSVGNTNYHIFGTNSISVNDKLWNRIRAGYDSLLYRLKQTAPQLKLAGGFGAWSTAFSGFLALPDTQNLAVN